MPTVAALYRKYRADGLPAIMAFGWAQVQSDWHVLERADLVKLEVVPDQYPDTSCWEEPHFQQANRDGVWGLVGAYLLNGEWVATDSVFGFIGDDWKESSDEIEVKRVTMDLFRKRLREQEELPLVRWSW